MNFLILLLTPSSATPAAESHISSLVKRDDYSLKFLDSSSRIDLQATDPDVNPLFLSLLLSFLILVLLVSISVADKLLQIEREKEYDPKEDDVTFPTLRSNHDTEPNVLWTNKIIVPDFKIDNTESLKPPATPRKDKDPMEEYNRLKQQLTSEPENNRDSIMSIESDSKATVISIEPLTISSSFRRQCDEDYHSVYLNTETGESADERLAAFLARETDSDAPVVNKNVEKIKSGIPTARLSTLSVMSTDSLL